MMAALFIARRPLVRLSVCLSVPYTARELKLDKVLAHKRYWLRSVCECIQFIDHWSTRDKLPVNSLATQSYHVTWTLVKDVFLDFNAQLIVLCFYYV